MVPEQAKIYHIVHADRLPSIIVDQHLWCAAEIARRSPPGTTIGMPRIKQRRLNELRLASYPDLHVGDCVPFYFCPRSVMLYVIHRGNNPDLSYRDGQESVLHLEADLNVSVAWAQNYKRRWAFTLSNAAERSFEDRKDLSQLFEINWEAVQTNQWRAPNIRRDKQAEFLMEYCFPWHLIERIGVHSQSVYERVMDALSVAAHRPQVEITQAWYY